MNMDADRQGFYDFCEWVEPMQKAYKNIAQTGRGLHSLLKGQRGPKMHKLCDNMRGVIKLIKDKKINVDPNHPDISGLKQFESDICSSINNKRKYMMRNKSSRTGPKMSRSIAKLANAALAHREELRQSGRWQPFMDGKDLRHMDPPPKTQQAKGHKCRKEASREEPCRDQDPQQMEETDSL